MVTFSRLGRKRRLVLMLEWLTLCPTCAPLPLSSHRHDIGEDLLFAGLRTTRAQGIDLVSIAPALETAGPFGRPRTYSDGAPMRQAGQPPAGREPNLIRIRPIRPGQ